MAEALPTVGESPIESVLLAMSFERRQHGFRFEATSLPGHLLQYMAAGRVRQECNGRAYELGPGSIIWYHEDELVRGEVLEAPWRVHSINIIAPTLPPPSEDARIARDHDGSLRTAFAAVVAAWQDASPGEARRALAVHAATAALLARLAPQASPTRIDPRARLWWRVETAARKRLDQPLDLAALAGIAGTSPASLVRSCRAAVALSPMKRLKRLRLSLARGLVQRSTLSITAIATRVGYGRVHEFSRDYRGAYDLSPREDRAANR